MNIIMFKILFSTLTLLLALQSEAVVTDPELDFIKTADDVVADYGLNKKNEIIRLELDLTGDGRPTIFLSYNGIGSRGGSAWVAYSPAPGGYLRVNGIQFREDLVRAGKVDTLNPNGGLLVLYPGKGAGLLARYEFTGNKAIQEEVQKLDYANPDHQRLFEQLFGRKFNEPLPEEFFNKPKHQVIEVKSIEARAISKLNNDVIETGANDTSRKVDPPFAENTPKTNIISSEKSVPTPTDEPTPSKPWITLVTLIVAACGLLSLLIKRR